MDPAYYSEDLPIENLHHEGSNLQTRDTDNFRGNSYENSSKIEDNQYADTDNYGNQDHQGHMNSFDNRYNNNNNGGFRPRGRGGFNNTRGGGRGGERGGYNNRYEDRGNNRGYHNNNNRYQNGPYHQQNDDGNIEGAQQSYDDIIGRVAQPGFKTEFEPRNPYGGNDDFAN
jgi:hypothetical protein